MVSTNVNLCPQDYGHGVDEGSKLSYPCCDVCANYEPCQARPTATGGCGLCDRTHRRQINLSTCRCKPCGKCGDSTPGFKPMTREELVMAMM